jgi:periplasmic copper chaperone A
VKKILFVGFLLILCSCSSDASLKFSNTWARPGLKYGNSAAYFTIKNNTDQGDRLVGAESDVAEKCEIHMTNVDAENNMRMMPQEFIQIPAREKVVFTPGGLHVMIMNLKNDLVPGENIHLTLKFEKAGKIEFDIPVKE